MENLIVDVKLWGQFVGSLVWDDTREMAVFEYDAQYRRNGQELAPLMMPLAKGARPFSFPSTIKSDSLPTTSSTGSVL